MSSDIIGIRLCKKVISVRRVLQRQIRTADPKFSVQKNVNFMFDVLVKSIFGLYIEDSSFASAPNRLIIVQYMVKKLAPVIIGHFYSIEKRRLKTGHVSFLPALFFTMESKTKDKVHHVRFE